MERKIMDEWLDNIQMTRVMIIWHGPLCTAATTSIRVMRIADRGWDAAMRERAMRASG